MIYISGAMTGIEDLNRRAFKLAYFKFLQPGTIVINPHDIGDKLFIPEFLPEKVKWCLYMAADCFVLLFCSKIYMLTGWERSKGAAVEHKIAEFMKKEIEYENILDN